MNLNEFFSQEYLTELYNEKFKNAKAKGIDKINSLSFRNRLHNELDVIHRKVISGTYVFTPYLENLVLKGRNKLPRIISIPTLRDRIVLLSIKEILHQEFPDAVQRKLPNSYIREIKGFIATRPLNVHFIKLDIKNFYDTIDRKNLLDKLNSNNLDARIIRLISAAIETPSVPANTKKENYDKYKTNNGVHQGLAISNILAQIYLSEIDSKIKGTSDFYLRYVDDIIILNREWYSNLKYERIKNALEKVKLKLNDEKTEKNKLSNGFTFLSYKITDKIVTIADKNVELFIRRIAGKFTWFKNGIQDRNKRATWLADDARFKQVFFEELNESITGIISSSKNYGWIFYFSEISDESLLFKIDKIISRFFSQLDCFNNAAPTSLKRMSRAYKVIKYDDSKNYICNFDKYDTVRKKRSYLILRGKIDPSVDYTDDQINSLFERFRKRQISNVEKDIGYRYV